MRSLLMLACWSSCFLGGVHVSAHCEMPCGIYADQQRFSQMLEDQETIAKAIKNIRELAGKTDPQSQNQLIRWVNTKESQATNTQHVIAQYFMTQRIKPDGERYLDQLSQAHVVMVAAMKCKQSAEDKAAKVLRETIVNFYRVYEGKEPQHTD